MSNRRRKKARTSRRPRTARISDEVTDEALALLQQGSEQTAQYYESRVSLHLDSAVLAYRTIVESSVAPSMRAEVWPLLADVLVLRYNETRSPSDLDDAIVAGETALRVSRQGDHAWINDTLAVAYALRLNLAGDPLDIPKIRNRARNGKGSDALAAEFPGEGLDIFLEALVTIEEVRQSDPSLSERERRVRDYWLAAALRLHFEAFGQHPELLRAAECAAMATTAPAGGEQLARALLELGTINCIKFEVSGQAAFLNEAIGSIEESLACDASDVTKGKAYGELAVVLRFKRAISGDTELDDYRTHCLARAIELSGEVDRPYLELQLATDELIEGSHDAVARAKERSRGVLANEDRLSRLYPQAVSLYAAALSFSGDPDERDEAISLMSSIDASTSHVTEMIPIAMMNLASALRERSRETGSTEDLTHAESVERAAIESGWVPGDHAIGSLLRSAAASLDRGEIAQSLTTTAEAVDLYCNKVTPFLSLADEQARLRATDSVMTEAASIYLRAGRPRDALDALRRITGRVRFFDRRMFHIRRRLVGSEPAFDDLVALHDHYEVVRAANASDDLAALDALHVAYDRLAETLRGIEDTDDVDCTLPSHACADDELRLFVFTLDRVSHVILETSDAVWSVELQIGASEAAAQVVKFGLPIPGATRAQGENEYWPDADAARQREVLHWIWSKIIGPVLDSAESDLLSVDRWSWAVFGDLSKLPLHAAADPANSRSLDAEVLSARLVGPTASQRPFAVGRPEVAIFTRADLDGKSDLRSPGLERDHLMSKTSEGLAVEVVQGDRSSVLSAIARPGVVHVSSHGVLRFENPSDSGLALDDFVSVEDILSTANGNSADLVVLSACSTSVDTSLQPYEPLAVTTALLAAGVPCVVGALWSIEDDDAAVLMAALYDSLLEDVVGAEWDVARAVQAASQELKRACPDEPSRWASLICSFGPG